MTRHGHHAIMPGLCGVQIIMLWLRATAQTVSIRQANLEQPPGKFHLFQLDLSDVVPTSVMDDVLRIELWRQGRRVTTIDRRS